MLYKDQLVLSGKIDNIGNPIRENVGESSRLGIETQVAYKFSKLLSVNANITLSDNRNDNYFVTEAGNLKNFGNTKLTYSPDVVAGGVISIKPSKCINIQLISKYVGKQFMDNRNIDASKLDAYFVENAFVSFEMKPKNYFKNLRLSLQVNNLFNKKYASNGYMWGDSPYYFPQAGTNYLLGMTLGF
jgi:iron complex outermembrane receptor protein